MILSFILGFAVVSLIKSAILACSDTMSSAFAGIKSIVFRSLLLSPSILPKNLNGASVMSANSFFTASQTMPPYLKSGSFRSPVTGRSMFI